MFKRFSFRAFCLCLLVVIALMIGSFFAAIPRDNGHAVQPWIVGVFNTMRYPSHLVFGNSSIDSWGAFIGGMVLNILLFTFLLERLTAIFRKRRQPAEAVSTHNPY